MKCSTCDSDPCVNPSFCRACRRADARKARGLPPLFDKPIGEYSAADLKRIKFSKMSPIERSFAERDDFIAWKRRGAE